MKKPLATMVAFGLCGCGGGWSPAYATSVDIYAGCVAILAIWAIALLRFRGRTKQLWSALEGENGGRKRGD